MSEEDVETINPIMVVVDEDQHLSYCPWDHQVMVTIKSDLVREVWIQETVLCLMAPQFDGRIAGLCKAIERAFAASHHEIVASVR